MNVIRDVREGIPLTATRNRAFIAPIVPEIDATKLQQAVDAAFDPPEAMTAAFVITWKGRGRWARASPPP